LDIYKESLSSELRKEIIGPSPSDTVFTFGNQDSLPSLATYTIPGQLAGRNVALEVDIVASDIPLLLSKTTMKNAKVKNDTENDTAEILGKAVPLNITSAGHYCVPFLPPKPKCQEVLQVSHAECFTIDLLKADEKEKVKAIKKIDICYKDAKEVPLLVLNFVNMGS
jgi:hypothetical protein